MQEISGFYIKRFFRLAPLFYVMLFVESLVVYILWHVKYHLLDYISTITFTFSFIPGMHASLVYAGWSVGVEWIFYILFPLVIVFLCNKKVATFAFLPLALFFAFRIDSIISTTAQIIQPDFNLNIIHYLIYFTMGIVVFNYMNELIYLKDKLKNYSHILSSILIVLTIGVITAYSCIRIMQWIPFSAIYALSWAVLLSASIIGFPYLLNNKFTRYLGKASYSIYLLHPFVINVLRLAGFYQYILLLFKDNLVIVFTLSAISTLILVYGLAYFSYTFIESPGMKAGKKIVNRMNVNYLLQKSIPQTTR